MVSFVIVASSGLVSAQEVINFSGLPAGYHAGTEGDPTTFEVFGSGGSGPIAINGFNPRFGVGVNAAVIFDTAVPTGQDLDLGSPNETCEPPGPGVGVAGQVGMQFENCPAEALNLALIVGENLADGDNDGLIDDPDDEGLSGFKDSVHLEFDFSALGSVTVSSITILDTEEPGPIVQLFGADDVLISSFQLPMTGNNGLGQTLSLGPTSGVERMNVALQGSGAVDNIAFGEGQPEIDIRKQAEGPDLRTFPSGSDVTFEIEVRNRGDVDLENVIVTDVLAPQCDRNIGTLAAGESFTYSCTVENLTDNLNNEACVEGDSNGMTVSDCDPSDVEVVAIDIRKNREGSDAFAVVAGNTATFEIEVRNIGPTALSNVEVTDLQAPGCAKFIGELAPGESFAYTCTVDNVTKGFVNEACVGGQRNGVRVDDCDPSRVLLIDIDIRKQEEGLDKRIFPTGSDVPFEIVVTNTGQVPLRDVEVTDAQVPGCGMFIGDLARGQSFSYTCVAQNVTQAFINEACVMGGRYGQYASDCDPSEVNLLDECMLSLDKQCVATPPPSGDLACDAKIAATTVLYTGPSVNDVTVIFEGDSDGLAIYTDVDLVSGQTVLTDPSQNGFSVDGQPGDLGSKMTITIDGVEEEHHTSCSTPYVAGLPAPLNQPKGAPSPTWSVVNFTDKNGNFVEQPVPPAPADLCQIFGSDGVLCEKRPTELSVRFNGGDCSQSDTTQDSGKWSCDGDAGAGSVRIVASSGGDVYVDEMSVAVGGVIDLLASAVGRSDLDSEMDFEIYDASGNLVQEVTFHTSCSQDLRIGDKFGGLEVVRFVNNDQGVVQNGGEVEYLYTVTNTGTIDVLNLFVSDDPLGDIGGIASLAPGDSVTLTTTAFISETITNIGVVVGEDAGGGQCSATDTATVELLPPPPPPPGDCSDGKPVLLTFEYTGEDCSATTNEQDGSFDCEGDPAFAEPIQIVITKDADEIEVDPTDETVGLGGMFSISRENGDKLKSETKFEIRQGGSMLQELTIHTSCSKDLNVGDQFGGVILRNFVPE